MIDAPIASVAVIGGGIVGWSAAAALKRRLPALDVTIVPVPPPADALADRAAATLPSVTDFHADLGLRDEDAVGRAGGSDRLGTVFDGWAAGLPGYVHAYDAYGRPLGGGAFHQHWIRAARSGDVAAFDRHSAAAMLARAGRLPPRAADPGSPFAGVQQGLFLDPDRYRAMMAAFARHLGVRVQDGSVAGVRLRSSDGFVEAVTLDAGDEIAADLFVDAAGPAAPIHDALGGGWEDWRRWLPCDRVLVAAGPPPADLPPVDHVEALAAGWRWRAASPTRGERGICYASAHLTDAAAAAILGVAGGAPATLRQGSRPEPWRRNCVAIGDAATAIEPLEWGNLHLAHSAIDRVIAAMPGRACHPLEVADYNRQAVAEAMRVRDFVLLHYATARRPEPFWQAAAAAEPPPSLAATLRQFAERGRLPFFEEETFGRDSWLAVLLGQGVTPRRTDPLLDMAPPAESKRAMRAWREAIDAAVRGLPARAASPAPQRERLRA